MRERQHLRKKAAAATGARKSRRWQCITMRSGVREERERRRGSKRPLKGHFIRGSLYVPFVRLNSRSVVCSVWQANESQQETAVGAPSWYENVSVRGCFLSAHWVHKVIPEGRFESRIWVLNENVEASVVYGVQAIERNEISRKLCASDSVKWISFRRNFHLGLSCEDVLCGNVGINNDVFREGGSKLISIQFPE